MSARQQSSSTSTHCAPTSRVPRQKMTIMSRQADGRLLLAALRHKVWPLIAFDARTITKAEREQILDYDPATGVSHNPLPQPAGPQAAMPRVGSPIFDSACTGLTSGCARPLIWYPLGALCQRDSALNEPQRRGAPTDGSRKTCLSAVGGRRKSLRGSRVSRAPAIHAAWRRGVVAHGAGRQLRPAPLRPLVETRHSFVCSRRPSTRDRRLFCLV